MDDDVVFRRRSDLLSARYRLSEGSATERVDKDGRRAPLRRRLRPSCGGLVSDTVAADTAADAANRDSLDRCGGGFQRDSCGGHLSLRELSQNPALEAGGNGDAHSLAL